MDLTGELIVTLLPGSRTRGAVSGMATITGTDLADTLTGSDGDVVFGGAGNDELYGVWDSTLYGDAGDDAFLPDDDPEYANYAALIFGGPGNDYVEGSAETFYGGIGNDRSSASAGDGFEMRYVSGPAISFGEAGSDWLTGDSLFGGTGSDRLDGGIADSWLFGGPGNDRAADAPYYDAQVIGYYGGRDRLYGGDGRDSLDGADDTDTVFGGTGDDVLEGGAAAVDLPLSDDSLYGGDGADSARGNGGDDLVAGGPDRDELDGGAGDDLLYGGLNSDKLHGAAGNDRLSGNESNDRLWGGAGDDILIADRGSDRLIGGTGDDTIRIFDAPFGSDAVLDFETGDRVVLSAALSASGYGSAVLTVRHGSLVLGTLTATDGHLWAEADLG